MLDEIYFKFHRYLALRFKFPELFLKKFLHYETNDSTNLPIHEKSIMP